MRSPTKYGMIQKNPLQIMRQKKRVPALLQVLFSVSGYQDSNLGPPAPKAGALTGLRYTPFLLIVLFSIAVQR